MKSLRVLPFALVLIAIVLCSLTWQSVTIDESGETFTSSGFSALPVATFLLVLPLLIQFGARYWGRVVSVISSVIAAVIGLLGCLPVWNLAMAQSPALTQSDVAAKTGIADWASQLELFSKIETHSALIYLTSVTLTLLALSNLISVRKIDK